ncbi:hypothetical protein [Nocardioides sp.]|jgi:hypothetical protein|uniref:hypothetical protein n=1 Tax=Nocardioides sp. TaxID=35761 RepID=UPI002621986D|nr:hypothetical protein [Nocardioides sp.]
MSALKKHLDDVVEAIVSGFRHAGDGISTKVGHMRTHASDVVSQLKKLDIELSSKVHGPGGVPKSKVDGIVEIHKPHRPDPHTYMTDAEIEKHLAPFRDTGAVRFTTQSSLDKYGSIGPEGGTYVMPKGELESLMNSAGDDLGKVENALGLNPGTLKDSDTVLVYIAPEDLDGLRVPDGNELGANEHWIPRGKTSGGMPEATINAPGSLPYSLISIGD